MEPIKITNKKEWSSIDIFLFSNGQQYSPPRKYHLRSEELQWWGTTLSYLGRTHYGSGHSSIELYATDGTKIDGPLELINGAAYVAVEPPDSFLNTGYEEYLLKASRSWEKRLAQKSDNIETLNPDSNRGEDPVLQSNTDAMGISERVADESSVKISSNAITPTQKVRPNKPYQRIQRKSIANSKQIQKKKSIDTHSASIKRICTDTDKVFSCPKKTSLKKNGSIYRKPQTVVNGGKLNEITNQELTSCCKKRGSIKPESDVKTEVTEIGEPRIINLYNNTESDLISLKNDSERCTIINHYNRQGQNHLTEDKVAIQNECICSSDPGTEDLEKRSTVELKRINVCEETVILSKNDFLENKIGNVQEDHVPTINNNKENEEHNAVLNRISEKQVIDEYVAHMNKGGLLLLKLKVKLKDCKTIFNKDKTKNITTTTSLSNLPETEKTSQVDINISFSGELLKPNDQQYTQNKSLQSILNKLCTEDSDVKNNKIPRIIVVQCACRNHSDKHKSCTCDTFYESELEGRKCDATLNQKLNETFTSCECQKESLRISNVKYEVRNANIIQSDLNENSSSLCKTNGTRVRNLAQKFEGSNQTTTIDKKKNSKLNDKHNNNDKSVNKNNGQSVVSSRQNDSAESERATENKISEENDNIYRNSKVTCNKSTQTDWCNILLEARLHDDDNYSFHLPSLFILKQCNL